MNYLSKVVDKASSALDTASGKLDHYGREYLNTGEAYEINGRHYQFGRKLAEGSFALVFLCRESQSGVDFAAKRVMVNDPTQMEAIRREIDLLRQLQHRNIVRFVDAASFKRPSGPSEVIVITEFCPGGSVYDLMYRVESRRLSEQQILSIFRDVVEAVAHLHRQSPPVQHRDLKVENVLLSRDRVFRLCDFGSATTRVYNLSDANDRKDAEYDINRNTTKTCRAPEMVDLYSGKVICEKADVWSLGTILYKMMFYTDAFEGALPILEGKYTIPKGHPYSPALLSLLQSILIVDPDRRPSAFDLLEKLTGAPVPRPTGPTASPSSLPPIQRNSPTRPTHSAHPAQAARPSANVLSMLDWQRNDVPARPTHHRAASEPSPHHVPSVDLFSYDFSASPNPNPNPNPNTMVQNSRASHQPLTSSSPVPPQQNQQQSQFSFFDDPPAPKPTVEVDLFSEISRGRGDGQLQQQHWLDEPGLPRPVSTASGLERLAKEEDEFGSFSSAQAKTTLQKKAAESKEKEKDPFAELLF